MAVKEAPKCCHPLTKTTCT